MGKTAKRPTTYVVYPAALFDGWEVVKDDDEDPACFDTRESATSYAKARAVTEGGAIVKLENWFGDTVSVWKVQPSQGGAQ
jgi:hypothetical protein